MDRELKYDKCKKITYRTRKEAKKALKQINSSDAGRKMEMDLKDVYLCEICQAWHTTSLEKFKSRSLNRRKNNT